MLPLIACPDCSPIRPLSCPGDDLLVNITLPGLSLQGVFPAKDLLPEAPFGF
jgi:hypothetical protein